MLRVSQTKVILFGVLVLFSQALWAGDALNFFNNWFVTGDYAVAGVGLRGTGVNGWATGKINMTGVPSGAQPIAAFLYWSTVESSPSPGASIGYFNTNKIQGAALGNPQSPNGACSSSGGIAGYGFVYRADVLRYLPVDSNNNPQANGNQTVQLPDAGPKGIGTYTNGASLVVIYRIVVPGLPTIAPLRAVVIYNGAFTMNKQSAGLTQNVAGFYQASPFAAARITGIVANGQPGFSSPLSVNGQTLDTDPFEGAQGGRWDNPSYKINLAANASSFSTLATVGNSQTCLTWAAIVASVNVQDTDNDGLLDIWETKGLHRNTAVSPATFGTCADYPAEPCVNLPAMGANPNKKDILIQFDGMSGTGDGTGGLDGFGAHHHMPQLAALNSVANTFSLHGISLHADVGNNYQGAQSICGNAPCSFIIPAAYAQGGADIAESTLLCQSTAKHTCDYQVPYPVLSFEYGFASVRDGNSLLKISPHFAQNRRYIFHYSLFAHALAGPFNAAGQPIDPNTLQPTNIPKSYSGIAHRPGGGFMVTLGLWRSDIPSSDQVGNVQVQAGTLMHELGHNLGLGHAGLSTKPNCMPNYPSIMNYLYQTRGLTDKSGIEQVDYSYGLLLPLSENFLSTSIPMGLVPGLQKYRVRYYGPLAPNQLATQAAQLHCDGTLIKSGEPFEVRLEGPAVSTPDWSNGTVPLGKVSPPLDVNYDGTTGQLFLDQPDWITLNLQQIGTGYNFGGLSVGALATDGGVFATDGGALATDAGALATDGGVFATDGGAFATDGGAFATDGGVFATDGGALATDGGALATDAGEIDQDTVLLSSVDPPSTLTATNTGSGITLTWTPPSVGRIANYNIYRCAIIAPATSCTPTFFNTSPGGTPTPTYNDMVSETMPPYHSGKGGSAVCNTSTCYNTTYYYFVTSVVSVRGMRNQESGDSNIVNTEVPHQFVIANAQPNIVYGAAIPAPTATVYGDGTLAISSVTCNYGTIASLVTPRNVGTYTIACTSAVTPPATDGVTYNAQYLNYIPGTLTITQRPITVTAAASTKTYDGTLTSTATPTVTLGSLVSPDTLAFTETYDNRNVGNTHVMTPAGVVNDTNGGNNYLVTLVNTQNGQIITRPSTATLTAQNKVYDGTNTESSNNMSCSLANAIAGDNVTCVPSAGTFNTTQVATANMVNATGALGGTAATNYTLGAAGTAVSSTPVSASANITTLPLTATLTSAPPKTYEGSTMETNPMMCSVAAVISPDVVTCAATNGNFDTSQVATASKVTATATISGSAVSNYTLGGGGTTVSVPSTSVSATSNITTRPVTATLTPQNKVYNGTNTEPSNNMSCSLNNAVQADVQHNNVTCSASNGTFNSSQVASATTVSATAMLGGPAATNYTFGANGTTMTSTGVIATPVSITPAPLMITASSASIAYGSPVLITPMINGLVNNENSSVLGTGLSCGTYYVPGNPGGNVGNYPTTCSGAVDSNYGISYVGGMVMVSPAPLTVTATGVNKSFDGTTNATVTLSDNRIFAGDTFSRGYMSASFSDPNPGTGKTVTVSGISISGTSNYTLTSTTAMTTANISDSIDLTALALNRSANSPVPFVLNGTELRLANDIGQASSAWLNTAIPVSSGFSTSFQFQISSATTLTLADGFAFVIQGNGTSAVGGGGGNLGYQGIPNSIAIEFDTYHNDGTGFNDPACSQVACAHIGIQSNGTGRNSPDHSAAGLAAPVLIDLSGSHTATITYDPNTKTLSVYLDSNPNPVVSANVDLSAFVLSGGTNAYVGFTAATGADSELTDLLSWTWN